MSVPIYGTVPRLLVGCLFAFSATTASAETTIRDIYFIAGKVGPILAVETGDGRWAKAPFVAAVGLEKTGQQRNRGIYNYSLVIDARQMKGVVPASCAYRFSIPWKELEKAFPRDPGMMGLLVAPQDEIWGEKRVSAERYELGIIGCSVRLWVGNVLPVKLQADPELFAWLMLEEEFPGLRARDFSGLTRDNKLMLKRGRLEFVGEGDQIELDFAFLHVEIPGLNWVPPEVGN